MDYTGGLRSPEIFRRWSAYSAVSGAIGRQVYLRVTGQKLYVNLYVLLVSDPGIGKSNAVKHARKVLRRVQDVKLTPMRITQRAFYHALQAAVANDIRSPTDLYRHCSLTAMIDEFGVFVKPHDSEFMVDLADAFDCPEVFDYVTATQGQNLAENVFFNMIGGTTPKYLKEAWTSTVLDQGFPARIILVYSDQIINADLFDTDESTAEAVDKEYELALADDLKIIHKLSGRYTWAKAAQKEMVDWFRSGMKPRPIDPRLEHYNTRRHIHLMKLCMLTSAAKRDDMEITMEDLEEARGDLIEVEAQIPKAIAGIGANPIRDQMVMVRRFVTQEYYRTKEPIREYRVRDLLMSELDPYRVPTMLNEMVIGHWLDAQGTEPTRTFTPGSHSERPTISEAPKDEE